MKGVQVLEGHALNMRIPVTGHLMINLRQMNTRVNKKQSIALLTKYIKRMCTEVGDMVERCATAASRNLSFRLKGFVERTIPEEMHKKR